MSQKRLLVPKYHIFDPLGSTDRLVSTAGAVTDTYIYKAFGEILLAGASSNPLRFVGRLGYWFDPDLGSSHVRRRPLQTAFGRWPCPDPARPGSIGNRYIYVRNQPSILVDPSGLFAIDPNTHDSETPHSWDPRDGRTAGVSNLHWVFALGDLPAVIQKVDSEASFEMIHCCCHGIPGLGGGIIPFGVSSATFSESFVELWTSPEGGVGRSKEVENHRKSTKRIASYVIQHCGITALKKTMVSWQFNASADFEAFNVRFNEGQWNFDSCYRGTNHFRVTSLVCCGQPVIPPPEDPELRNLYPIKGAVFNMGLDVPFPPGPPGAQIREPSLTCHDEWTAQWSCGMRSTKLEYVTSGYH